MYNIIVFITLLSKLGGFLMSIKMLKENALDQLKGRWGLSIGTLLTYYLILYGTSIGINIYYSIISSINSQYSNFEILIKLILINNVISLFIFGVFEAGKCKFLLNITKDCHCARFIDIFSQFKIYFKVLLLSWFKIIFSLLWFVPAILVISIPILIYIVSQPIDMIFIPQYYFTGDNLPTTIFILISIYIIIIITIIIINLIYSQVFYIIADNPKKSIFSCLKESRYIMKGNKFKFIILNLSFTGWFIVSALTLGIASLWIFPYFELTKANFYINAN